MTNGISHIKENIEIVRQRIAQASAKAGRKAEDIILVAVSKTFAVELIEEACRNEITDIGENYMQEALGKISSLSAKGFHPRWHFIGTLQKNKVRPAVKHFALIQSVDSLSLLQRIERIAGEENKKIEVLLEINLVGEASKSGLAPEDVVPILESSVNFMNIKICGLMTIPPYYDDPERNRKNFAKLKSMFDEIGKKGYPNWQGKYISMGMTDDFEIAIEEGSNMVRIGRAIFGERRR